MTVIRLEGGLQKSDFREISGTQHWKSPSNIALVKYWGKTDVQIPLNPSLSFTLSASYTDMAVAYKPKENDGKISISFSFHGEENEKFEQRIRAYLQSLTPVFPWLTQFHLDIASSNSFPHSGGIASSASAMSALALNLVSIYNDLAKEKLNTQLFYRLASHLARLASGSACRSMYGGFCLWGRSVHYEHSSDFYAIPIGEQHIHPDFFSLHDDILIVDSGEKSVSSSEGHRLMTKHPFAKTRYKIARSRIGELREILRSGDLMGFGRILEEEALMLHALMWTSNPSFILLKPNSLAVINAVRDFRIGKKLPVSFTLDAGANVHLIYPAEIQDDIDKFKAARLVGYCENEFYLCDLIGKGPERLSE